MRYKYPEATLESVQQKLRWGAGQEAFSASIDPKECQFLLDLIDANEKLTAENASLQAALQKTTQAGIHD